MAQDGRTIEVITKEAFSRAMSILEDAWALKKDLNPTKKTVVIEPDQWEDGSTVMDPYYCSLVISELEGCSTVEINVSETLSDIEYYNQLKVLELAEICRIKRNGTTLTLVCYGDKPTVDLTIDISMQ